MSNQFLPGFLLSCSPLMLEPWIESAASYVILSCFNFPNFSFNIFKIVVMASIS